MNRLFFDNARLPRSPVAWSAARLGRGFTLIELLVTLAVAAVLMMVAVPSFKNLTLSNKLATTANDVVGALNVARMEAIKLNANTQFCSDLAASNPAGACTSEAGAVEAGAVYAVINGTVTQLHAGTVGLSPPLRLSGNMTAVRFGGTGLAHAANASAPYEGRIADICTSAISSNNHRVIDMAAGSIITTTTTTGNCP